VSSSAAALRAKTRETLLALALTSEIGARAVVDVVSTSSPTSLPPTGQRRPLAEAFARELDRAGDDVHAIGALLRRASDELDAIKRRPLANVTTETFADLHAEILDRGQGFTAHEVAVALRCTPTMVRRARLVAGLEPERGRAVQVNGNGVELGLTLIANGMSVRAASAIAGVPRSTLHDHSHRVS
jgi:hypothetical protein